MKPYIKPVVISEQILEKTALECDDYLYYIREYEGCREHYEGRGKESAVCGTTHS